MGGIAGVSPKASVIAMNIGAWLNHTTKVIKNAIHEKWSVRMLGVFRSEILNFD
jgi:hypothetical protein